MREVSNRPRLPASGLAADDDLAEFRIPGVTRCQVCLALAEMPEPDATKLRKALAVPREISAAQIAEWAKARKYRISEASATNHRRNHAGA